MPGNGSGRPPGPMVPPSLETLQQEFEVLRESNQAKLIELQRRGIAADPLSLVHSRIDILISSIAQLTGPNAPIWDVMARLAFERQLAAEMAKAESEGTRMQLASASQFTPGMVAELARQTGTFRPKR